NDLHRSTKQYRFVDRTTNVVRHMFEGIEFSFAITHPSTIEPECIDAPRGKPAGNRHEHTVAADSILRTSDDENCDTTDGLTSAMHHSDQVRHVTPERDRLLAKLHPRAVAARSIGPFER